MPRYVLNASNGVATLVWEMPLMKDLNCVVDYEGSKWAPQGIATKIDVSRFVVAAIGSIVPPWRPIPSRLAAQFLGTSLQCLANWRMRDLGPATEPMRRGQGNRIYYRPDKIAEWLSGGKCSDWLFSALWLQQMGMPPDVISEDAVRERIAQLENVNNLFPVVNRLWRNFREVEVA